MTCTSCGKDITPKDAARQAGDGFVHDRCAQPVQERTINERVSFSDRPHERPLKERELRG